MNEELLREYIELCLEGRTDLPQYPGRFVGQSQTTNGREKIVRVPIKDKLNGTQRWMPVSTIGKNTLVWDGSEWIPEKDFNLKFARGGPSPASRPGGKESVDDFVRRGGKVKRVG